MDVYEQPSDHDEELSHILKGEIDEQNFSQGEESFEGDGLFPPLRGGIADSEESNYSPSFGGEDEDGDPDGRAHSPTESDRYLKQQSPLKRGRALTVSDLRPFKRHKGLLNHDYMGLLNRDIQDAALRFITHESRKPLTCSQIGLTFWTDAEKEAFFEALSRVGSHDTAATIAIRIPTKTEFQVAQYLRLLRDSAAERTHTRQDHPDPVTPADLPAAFELSQDCCNALEEAADVLSLKQEVYEESIEKRRWGDDRWLITQSNCAEIEREHKDDEQPAAVEEPSPPEPPSTAKEKRLKSAQLFKFRNWLELSERVMMNSSTPENNWASISDEQGRDEPPALRATALEDFYSLVVDLTKRLVATTIYVSESRARSKSDRGDFNSAKVWPRDVEAAALSLKLPLNRHNFWAGSARRLRLHVYDGELPSANETDKVKPMSYRDVETKLGLNQPLIPESDDDDDDVLSERASSVATTAVSLSTDHSDNDDDDQSDNAEKRSPSPSEFGSGCGLHSSPTKRKHQPKPKKPIPLKDQQERAAVQDEVDEFIDSSPFEIPYHVRKLMRRRIRAGRQQEAYADELDLQASAAEEQNMWRLLNRCDLNGQEDIGKEDKSGGQQAEVEVKLEDQKGGDLRPQPRRVEGRVEDLYEYWCGDGGREKFKVIETGDEEVEVEAVAEGLPPGGVINGSGKAVLPEISKWELDWMAEKQRRRKIRERSSKESE